jgi:hypothetical protein
MKKLLILILAFQFNILKSQNQYLSNDKNTPLIILVNTNAHQNLIQRTQKLVCNYCKDTTINSECYMVNYSRFEAKRVLENSDFYGLYNMMIPYLKKYRTNIYFHAFNGAVWHQDLDSMSIILSAYPSNSELVLFDHRSSEWMFGLTTDKNQHKSFYNLVNWFPGKNIFIGSCNSENLLGFLPKNKNYLVIDKFTKYFVKNQHLGRTVEEVLININISKWIPSESIKEKGIQSTVD